MAGPWFTVQTESDGWQQIDTIWLSNGRTNEIARVELRVRMGQPVITDY